MSRPPIPKPLERRLLYESQYACVVCQRGGCHIHHIDQDHSNNKEENLVVLCVHHHDEAHTKRKLSKNLDSNALKDAKRRWTDTVRERRQLAATVSGQKALSAGNSFFSAGIAWGYLNHKRVTQMIKPSFIDAEGNSNFQYCVNKGLVDQNAILIKPKNVVTASSYVANTIYDWFDFGDDQRLHLLYTALVDQIIKNGEVIYLEPESWTKARIKGLVSPGVLIFVDRAFYFKSVEETKENQHRRCRTFKRKISIEFFVDTRDMFGTTSITVSFSGHRNCAALVQLKSIEETDHGALVLHCTPIALGVGFKEIKPLDNVSII